MDPMVARMLRISYGGILPNSRSLVLFYDLGEEGLEYNPQTPGKPLFNSGTGVGKNGVQSNKQVTGPDGIRIVRIEISPLRTCAFNN
jgi:hypothetical protein